MRQAPAAPRRAASRASAMATPLAAAQPSASVHPVEGAAGLAGGSVCLTRFHPPTTAFDVSRAAASDEPAAATFHPSFASTSAPFSLSVVRGPRHGAGQTGRLGNVAVMFPGEQDYLAERAAMLATMESLTPDEFENGPTLCEGWAPRDVLAHVMGIDEKLTEYLKAAGNVHKANARIVERMRALSGDELLDRARRWAANPPMTSRVAAYGLLGDVSVHHQDVVRGLGRHREVPRPVASAILREGTILGIKRLTDHRVVATDTGRKIGRGRVVTGPAEALGMWLCGRRGIDAELVFGPAD